MTLWFTLLGLLVGSVAVHVAEAIMTHRRMTLPVCPHCTNPAPWSQWSATLAYVSGRAHCPHCGAKVRSARLAGELLLAATWGLLIWRFGLSPRVMLTMVTTIPLAMLMVTDLETRRIPNLITFPATGAMLLLGTFIGTAFPTLYHWHRWDVWEGAAVGFLIMRLLVSLGVAVFGPGAMGEGDITLATYLGAMLGFPMILEALVLGFLLGGVGAAGYLLTKRGAINSAIPYGPYIILGGIITLLWGTHILVWFMK